MAHLIIHADWRTHLKWIFLTVAGGTLFVCNGLFAA
jgi:hypothetical protein